MFQTGFPSIIRSSKLHVQRQAFVRQVLLPAASLAGMELVYMYYWGSANRPISFGVTYLRSQCLTGTTYMRSSTEINCETLHLVGFTL